MYIFKRSYMTRILIPDTALRILSLFALFFLERGFDRCLFSTLRKSRIAEELVILYKNNIVSANKLQIS